METLTIELINDNAIRILREMENVSLIKILKKHSTKKKNIGELLYNSISKESSDKMHVELKLMREEWDRTI